MHLNTLMMSLPNYSVTVVYTVCLYSVHTDAV